MSFFKILSKEEFEEVRKDPIGYSLHLKKARILPDRNLIHDMLFDHSEHWEEISEQEYEEMKIKTSQ